MAKIPLIRNYSFRSFPLGYDNGIVLAEEGRGRKERRGIKARTSATNLPAGSLFKFLVTRLSSRFALDLLPQELRLRLVTWPTCKFAGILRPSNSSRLGAGRPIEGRLVLGKRRGGKGGRDNEGLRPIECRLSREIYFDRT